MSKKKKYAVLSFSGGLDSSTLLLRLLREDYEVLAISFDYGQKHKIELEKAKELVEYLNKSLIKEYRTDRTPEEFGKVYPKIIHKVIELKGLAELFNSALVEGGEEVPEGEYEEENMKDTFVPNRNKIFSSIIQAVALSISEKENEEVKIALGIHGGDHSLYPDTTQEFRDADYKAFKVGNWGSEKVEYFTPYIKNSKDEVLEDGVRSCNILGLHFNDVYSKTFSSYKPVRIEYSRGGTMEGMRNGPEVKFYSDYKSSTSIERINAFITLGIPDPIDYADENGIVKWDAVKKYVEGILKFPKL